MAMHDRGGWRVRRVPLERIPQIELTPVLALRHPMQCFLEVDVTEPRRRLRDHRARTGASLSFTAFIIGCLARAIDQDRQVQAFRRGHRLVVFDQVDVSTLVEVDAGGTPTPLPYVIRDAASKSVPEIHAELRRVQHDPGGLLDQVRHQVRLMRWIPRPVRWLCWQVLARSPRLWVRFGGTVVITSVGMFGSGRGWGHGLACYPVSVTVGGIDTVPRLADGRLEAREHLCLTLSLDHEVIDGAPAARFVADLRRRIEQAEGIEPADLTAPHASRASDARRARR